MCHFVEKAFSKFLVLHCWPNAFNSTCATCLPNLVDYVGVILLMTGKLDITKQPVSPGLEGMFIRTSLNKSGLNEEKTNFVSD